jgi:hypothetical protein
MAEALDQARDHRSTPSTGLSNVVSPAVEVPARAPLYTPESFVESG